MKTISSSGVEFTTAHWPILPDRPTILFLHGASLSKEFWTHQVTGLAVHFNTIAVDLPGHGGSGTNGKDTILGYASSMIDFLDDILPDTPIILCGLSMGGAIAQQLLVTNPERFMAGILINTGARLKVLPAIFDMVTSNYEDYLKSLSMFSMAQATDKQKLQPIIDEFTSRCTAEVTLGDFSACNTFDIMEKVSDIQCPVLIISSSEDVSTPPKYGKWLDDHIATAHYVVLDDAGHFAPIERPNAVNNAITAFIDSIKSNT